MESVSCNLCQAETARHWLTSEDPVTGESFDIVQCSRCGLRYTNPRPTPDAMAVYYARPEKLSSIGRRVKRWLRRRRARWSAAGLPPGRVLEIGCGDGWMLDTLRAGGWEAVGTERSEGSAARARKLGLDVRVGDLAGHAFAAQSFDLVILWHVLEHLHDPLGTLTQVRRLIRPAGRLIVAVPNSDSWQMRLAGRRWVHLDVPRHLYHFNPATLGLLLPTAGFRARAWFWGISAYDIRGWWEMVTTYSASTATAATASLLAALMTPLAIGLSALAARRRASATIIVQALLGAQNSPLTNRRCFDIIGAHLLRKTLHNLNT